MAGRINRAVVGLVLDGLRRFASDALPPQSELDKLRGDDTGVALEPYRAVLDAVVARAGWVPLLRAGQALTDLVDPILFVLLNSETVRVVIEKEARLGRFIHSRHVVRVLEESASGIVLEHASTTTEPPRPTEDLAAAGQHIALFEQLGCQGLRLSLPDAVGAVVYDDGRYFDPQPGSFAVWRFEWQSFVATRRPMAGLDAVLLRAESRPELNESSDTVLQLQKVVHGDLGRTWTLSDVAKKLGTSPRSLQRELSQHATTFSSVLDEIRVDEARRLLSSTDLTITQIGYVCGFSDTSHFSRRFKSRVGTSPSSWREARRASQATDPG